jgi:hypothetical protein
MSRERVDSYAASGGATLEDRRGHPKTICGELDEKFLRGKINPISHRFSKRPLLSSMITTTRAAPNSNEDSKEQT